MALFAALSYAVTQSGRGGGTIDKEQSLIDAAQITQYAISIQAIAMRMVLTGTAATDLELNLGGGFDFTNPCATGENCVYAPEGGGAVYQTFNSKSWSQFPYALTTGVSGIGQVITDRFMMIEVTQSVCDQINKGLGLAYNPVNFDPNGSISPDIDAYPGESFACFEYSNGSGTYFYYHVLVAQ